MPIYHVVLFKTQPGVTAEQVATWRTAALGLVGKIPGLESLKVGPPHPSTVHRSHGYEIAVFAVLDKAATIQIYQDHPEHVELLKIGKELFEIKETLAYDLEF